MSILPATKPKTIQSLHLFSTADVRAGREKELIRLFQSVELFRSRNSLLDVHFHVLLQRCDSALPSFVPKTVSTIESPSRFSLSAARNILLAQALSKGNLGRDSIIAFPDDDAWYPAGFLERTLAIFESSSTMDFFFCRYSSSPDPWSENSLAEASLAKVIRYASSNTMFLRGNIANAVGYFDELLGVGARYNGGEDTDYAIRAFKFARTSRFLDVAAVGHRDLQPRLKPKHYSGSLRAIARGAPKLPGGKRQICRKLLVGLSLLLTGKLNLKAFADAIGSVFQPRLQPTNVQPVLESQGKNLGAAD